jgi:hypothetical protein
MRKIVGISQKIKRAWLDVVLDKFVQTTDEKEVRAFLNEYLRKELPGTESRAKASGIVLRIWSGVDRQHVSLQHRAVGLMPRISGQERIWLHWGMATLAYPFFRDLSEVVGRLLALQDDFTTMQVQARMLTAWGDRTTTKEAVQKLITSLLDWEVLRSRKQGHFFLAGKLTTGVIELQLWLLEALLRATAAEEVEVHQLLRLPESFPFKFTASLGDLRKSEGFNIHRQGLDMDMVVVRRAAVERMMTSAAKQRKPKQPGTGNSEQTNLFGT